MFDFLFQNTSKRFGFVQIIWNVCASILASLTLLFNTMVTYRLAVTVSSTRKEILIPTLSYQKFGLLTLLLHLLILSIRVVCVTQSAKAKKIPADSKRTYPPPTLQLQHSSILHMCFAKPLHSCLCFSFDRNIFQGIYMYHSQPLDRAQPPTEDEIYGLIFPHKP